MDNVGTMDFFGHQDVARRKTSLLVVYYILAVCFIIAAVYGAFALVIFGTELKTSHSGETDLTKMWNPEVFLYVIIGTVLLVATGTFYKIAQLGKGGEAVARMLGGKRIQPNTTDPAERRFLNVVEEMAIASGTAVASVYILEDEPGINAFAAGFNPSDAIVAATRGCIEKLSRDELQGVVAHEFSHILNGDMRLNIKLTGVLHGILLISLVGYWIMRSSGSRGSSSSRKGGGQLVILGLMLFVIGYIGVFFGKLIKSALSRQREFLADASAVQFTRNPEGISGVLKKIGGYSAGSKIRSSNAEEASHFFFANGLTSSFMSMFSTHPPLDERIARIDPTFTASQQGSAGRAGSHAGSGLASGMVSGISGGTDAQISVTTDDVVASIGQPGQAHLAFASKILSSIPDPINRAARDPSSARAVIYSLLLSSSDDVTASQMAHLKANADPVCLEDTTRLSGEIGELGPEYRVPLADIAITALKEMSSSQYMKFVANVDWLAAADKQVDLFEYALKNMVKRRLQPVFGVVEKVVIQYYDIKPLTGDAARLLSCIAYWGADHMDDATRAFDAGLAKMGLGEAAIVAVDHCGLDMVDQAIERIKQSSPFVKKRIIEGCIECVALDGKVTVDEAELVGAIADGLDCPVPPLMAGSLEDAA